MRARADTAFGPTHAPLRAAVAKAPRHSIRAKTDFSLLRQNLLQDMLMEATGTRAEHAEYDYILCGMGTSCSDP